MSASAPTAPDSCRAYTVAWIAALSHERAAAEAMLDVKHKKPPADFRKNASDPNTYTWGTVEGHHVVIAALPVGEYGTNATATIAQGLRSSLPHIRIGLLVGIGAGVPGEQLGRDGRAMLQQDIRLGDVAVSVPQSTSGGVVQVDLVKAKTISGKDILERKGHLDSPPMAIRTALSKLQAEHELDDSRIPEFLEQAFQKHPKMKAKYAHPGMKAEQQQIEPKVDIYNAQDGREITREARAIPEIHYGVIASSNTLEKSSSYRREVLARLEEEHIAPICFEMEAAGLMNSFPCLVIRGICDYADEHKNDDWQRYAAATAAAFAKELLSYMDREEVDQAAMIGDLLKDIQDISENVNNVQSGVQELQHHVQCTELDRWLSAPDLSTNYIKALKQRHDGTGNWLLDGKDLSDWMESQHSFLWLYGIPGCGKTILSTSVIERLQQLSQSSDSHSIVIYFYFDFNDTAKQTVDSMVRSLIAQSSYQSKDNGHLNRLFERCGNGKTQPNTDALLATLQGMLQACGQVRVMLDALDECTTRKELLQWLEGLVAPRAGSIQLIATSRREQEIELGITKWANPTEIVSIQEGLVNDDISAYVKARIEDPNGDLKRWRSRPDVQSEIERRLMEKSQGMFRWAACQLDALEDCLDLPSLRLSLSSLPASLYETYDRILVGIPKQRKHHAIRILQFLTYSERPLRLEEAIDAIAVPLEQHARFDQRDRMPDASEVARVCSSLVTIVRISSSDKDSDQDEEHLQLAHFSVKEYLISGQIEENFRRSLHDTAARSAIAKVSLIYLLSLDHGLDDASQCKIQFPLSKYSARHWIENAALAKESDEDLQELILELFTSQKEAYHTWLNLYDPDCPWKKDDLLERNLRLRVGFFPHPLYYASSQGLFASVQSLLQHGADVNDRGGHYGNALQAASYRGDERVVRLLLDEGAEVNADGGKYGNALQAASYGGNERVVQLLLDEGAEVNAEGEEYDNALGGQYGNALQAASYGGNERVVQLLLDEGAEVNAEGGQYSNALQAASIEGHEGVVRLLLNKGADVNAEAETYSNALQAASEGGHETVVRLLLDEGADVNAQGDQQGSALQAACYEGNERVVRLLLDKGAEVNAQGTYYGNALEAASEFGHETVVRLLLDKGADINAQGRDNSYALHAASRGGHETVVRLLLDKGADVNAQGGEYSNALQAASRGGHKTVVRLLLENGAGVNA